MAVKIIPFEDRPFFKQRVLLNGEYFRLDFHYSDRSDRWHLSIYTDAEDPLALGMRLVPYSDLSFGRADERWPKGFFIVTRVNNLDADPGRDDFGANYLLMFIEDLEP